MRTGEAPKGAAQVRSSGKRPMVSRGQVRHVFGVFGPGYGDHASRRTFQSRRGRMHSGTECLVHIEMCGFSVGYAFDFRYAMEFVVTHMGTISSLDVYRRRLCCLWLYGNACEVF